VSATHTIDGSKVYGTEIKCIRDGHSEKGVKSLSKQNKKKPEVGAALAVSEVGVETAELRASVDNVERLTKKLHAGEDVSKELGDAKSTLVNLEKRTAKLQWSNEAGDKRLSRDSLLKDLLGK